LPSHLFVFYRRFFWLTRFFTLFFRCPPAPFERRVPRCRSFFEGGFSPILKKEVASDLILPVFRPFFSGMIRRKVSSGVTVFLSQPDFPLCGFGVSYFVVWLEFRLREWEGSRIRGIDRPEWKASAGSLAFLMIGFRF